MLHAGVRARRLRRPIHLRDYHRRLRHERERHQHDRRARHPALPNHAGTSCDAALSAAAAAAFFRYTMSDRRMLTSYSR